MKNLKRWSILKNLSYKKKTVKSIVFKKVITGLFAIKSLSHGILTYNQANAVHLNLRRRLKPRGQVWLKVLPNLKLTKKGTKNRMGKGKGKFDKNVFIITPGTILFEFRLRTFIRKRKIRLFSIFNEIRKKLPIRVKIISFRF